MDRKSYPRPVCARCGMAMVLRQDAKKWYCETCREFTEPREPPRLEKPKLDPSRPKRLWLRLAIVAAFLLILAILRMYLI